MTREVEACVIILQKNMRRVLSVLGRGQRVFSLNKSAGGRFALMKKKNYKEEYTDLRRRKVLTCEMQLLILS